MKDVSVGGAKLVLEERPDIGSQLRLEIALPGGKPSKQFDGEVVWVRSVPQKSKSPSEIRCFFVGIQFQKLDPITEKALNQVLSGSGDPSKPA